MNYNAIIREVQPCLDLISDALTKIGEQKKAPAHVGALALAMALNAICKDFDYIDRDKVMRLADDISARHLVVTVNRATLAKGN